jgi:hypothetical protein
MENGKSKLEIKDRVRLVSIFGVAMITPALSSIWHH